MKPYLKFVIVIPAGFAILLSFFIFLWFREKRNFDSYISEAKVFANIPLPQSNLTGLESASDQNFNNDVLRGKVLLIYLSVNCGACKKEVKTITESLPELNSKIKIYGLTVEEKEKAKKYADENNLGFPVLFDNGGKIFSALSIKYFPTKILVENGIIKKTWFGSSPSQESFIESLELGAVKQ